MNEMQGRLFFGSENKPSTNHGDPHSMKGRKLRLLLGAAVALVAGGCGDRSDPGSNLGGTGASQSTSGGAATSAGTGGTSTQFGGAPITGPGDVPSGGMQAGPGGATMTGEMPAVSGGQGPGGTDAGGSNVAGSANTAGGSSTACGQGTPGVAPLAFPGAEGWGAKTPGGRGGKVIEVTNLEDSGPGSLRAAVEQSGPRTIVFRVSGTIELRSEMEIRNPNLTIAGQTAPGDGICLKNHKFLIGADDVVVRHVRFRRGRANGDRDDALAIESKNVIVDHCSMSWGTDETLNTWHGAEDITVQWSIVSEALHHNDHGFAATLGGVRASYHHLLIANCPGRNPSIGGNHAHQTRNMDFRNSVIYNFGHRTFDGKPTSVNIINNYFKPGPNSTESYFANVDDAGVYSAIPTTAWYVAGNVWEGNPTITNDNRSGVTGATQWLVDQPNEFAPITTTSADQALTAVLTGVGATLPKRDPVDARIVEEASTGRGTFGNGVVLHPDEVGGYPTLNSTDPPPDDDHDGMPNSWEIEKGLDPNSASDGPQIQPDGYSNLEHYLNCIGHGA